jgi:hypothetical protein
MDRGCGSAVLGDPPPQPGHLPGNRAHANARRFRAQNRRDEFLVGKGGSTLLLKFLAGQLCSGMSLMVFMASKSVAILNSFPQ